MTETGLPLIRRKKEVKFFVRRISDFDSILDLMKFPTRGVIAETRDGYSLRSYTVTSNPTALGNTVEITLRLEK